MKFTLPPIFCLLFVVNLCGQRHALGVKIGVQFPNYYGDRIDLGEDELSYDGQATSKPFVGVFYRHPITKKIDLEVAPTIFNENFQTFHAYTSGPSRLEGLSLIKSVQLYLPITLRFDIGHQLYFSLGGGSNLYLYKINDVGANQPQKLGEQFHKIFGEVFEKTKPWMMNLEAGLSYGFKRMSINGRFVYRVSDIYDSFSFSGINYPTNFRSNYLQLEVSYRLGKKQKS